MENEWIPFIDLENALQLVVAEMQRFSNHFVGYIENERKGERIKKCIILGLESQQ